MTEYITFGEGFHWLILKFEVLNGPMAVLILFGAGF
jgi:hypothetical protein